MKELVCVGGPLDGETVEWNGCADARHIVATSSPLPLVPRWKDAKVDEPIFYRTIAYKIGRLCGENMEFYVWMLDSMDHDDLLHQLITHHRKQLATILTPRGKAE